MSLLDRANALRKSLRSEPEAPHYFFGRRILMTTLDPIPPLFRTAPGCVAMNGRELDLVNKNDYETVAYFVGTLQTADSMEARMIGVHRRQKRPRRQRLMPSARMAMAAAIL